MDAMAACFTKDAELTMTIGGGDVIGPFSGIDNVMKLFSDSLEGQDDQRRHLTTNTYVMEEDDSSAHVKSVLTLLAIVLALGCALVAAAVAVLQRLGVQSAPASSALRLLIADEAHEPDIRAIARKVLEKAAEEPVGLGCRERAMYLPMRPMRLG